MYTLCTILRGWIKGTALSFKPGGILTSTNYRSYTPSCNLQLTKNTCNTKYNKESGALIHPQSFYRLASKRALAPVALKLWFVFPVIPISLKNSFTILPSLSICRYTQVYTGIYTQVYTGIHWYIYAGIQVQQQ